VKELSRKALLIVFARIPSVEKVILSSLSSFSLVLVVLDSFRVHPIARSFCRLSTYNRVCRSVYGCDRRLGVIGCFLSFFARSLRCSSSLSLSSSFLHPYYSLSNNTLITVILRFESTQSTRLAFDSIPSNSLARSTRASSPISPSLGSRTVVPANIRGELD
jgi:hypothetical protein